MDLLRRKHDGFNPLQFKSKRKKTCKEGYPCYECEFVAPRAGNPKPHIESKNKGVRYSWLQCDHAA